MVQSLHKLGFLRAGRGQRLTVSVPAHLTPFPCSFVVEFSKPTQGKPIPEGTVKVFFRIIIGEKNNYDIEFNFENESLKHKLNRSTMRTNMFEVSAALAV